MNVLEQMKAFIDSNEMDRQTDYLQRGRCFNSLNDDDLSERWVEAIRTDPASLSVSDLKAEAALRAFTLPYHLVADEIGKLVRHISEAHAAGNIDEEAFNSDFEDFLNRTQN